MTHTHDRHGKKRTPSDKVAAPQPGAAGTPPLHDNDGPSADARSGTGQATPHHGLDDASGRDADDMPPSAPVGPSYQSGGTRQDRAQQDEERKQRDSGAGVARNPHGGADPAPGAPATRDGPDRV